MPVRIPRRRYVWAAALAGVIAVGAALAWHRPPDAAQIGGPFTLVGGDGQVVRSNAIRTPWRLIYFGYTRCPDVCPTTLQAMALALRALAAEAVNLTPIFITIDPVHDTPQVVARYARLFDPRILGLSGSQAQVHEVEREFGVYASAPAPNGSIDHSSLLYLARADGKVVQLFASDMAAPALADALRRVMQFPRSGPDPVKTLK